MCSFACLKHQKQTIWTFESAKKLQYTLHEGFQKIKSAAAFLGGHFKSSKLLLQT